MKKYYKFIFCLLLVILITPLYTATAKAANLHIEVVTSSYIGSGTDANVQIRIYGNSGYDVVYYLDNDENNFEFGQTDTFDISNVRDDLGEIRSVALARDNDGLSPNWRVDCVYIEYTSTKGTSTYASNFDKWIDTQWTNGKGA
jgi:PLAT/LH2 domain.